MKRSMGVVACCLIVSSFPMEIATAANTNGAKCSKIGQVVTVKIKKKSTDLICTQVGKNKIWRKRTAATPGSNPTGSPTPTAQVGAAPASSSSAVTQVTSSYAILADSPYTRVASGTNPSGYLSAVGLASTTGSTLFDHPSGLASNGTNLLLVDRGNNRILVWNIAPTSSSTPPDFVLCQNSVTSIASGSGLNQCNWPSDAVVTSSGKMLVADSDNNRILVWNTMPTTTGQSASYAIDLGADAWPWGIWSNGTKVVASLTTKAQLRIWNTFPTTGSEPADITIEGNATNCLGTPRGVVSNGTAIIVGDHNGKCANSSVAHVFTSWPTSSGAAVGYDIVPEDGNYAWPHGSFDSATGKMYLLSRYLVEYSDAGTTLPRSTKIATGTPFEGGDGGDVEIVNSYLYATEYNGNRVAVFKGIPTASASASFYIGSPGVDTSATNKVVNTLQTNYMITNPQVATLGGAMAISSDFDRKIYVWKNIPATDGAKPDLVWTTQNQNDSNPLLAMDFQPDSSAASTAFDGRPLYAVAGEKTFVIWRGIPTKITDVPSLNIKNSIGNVNFSGSLRVAADSKYFYILDGDAKRIYVWSGIPTDQNDSPDFSIGAEVNRIRSDGNWLVGTSLYQSPHILVWSVSALGQNAAATGRVSFVMNLPQDAIVANGVLIVADTGFHRILAWNSVSAAIAGGSPDAFLGTTGSSDKGPNLSTTETRWPASLWAANGYLWVGERKFGHRVLRFALS